MEGLRRSVSSFWKWLVFNIDTHFWMKSLRSKVVTPRPLSFLKIVILWYCVFLDNLPIIFWCLHGTFNTEWFWHVLLTLFLFRHVVLDQNSLHASLCERTFKFGFYIVGVNCRRCVDLNWTIVHTFLLMFECTRKSYWLYSLRHDILVSLYIFLQNVAYRVSCCEFCPIYFFLLTLYFWFCCRE